MENIKLVMVDIDGTLLNDEKKIPEANIEAIKKLGENNIKFGIASGRPISSIKTVINDGNINDYVDFIVGSNGAEVYIHEKDEVIHNHFLDVDTIKNIEKLYADLPCSVCVYDGDDLVVNKETPQVRTQASRLKINLKVEDYSTYITKDFPKVLLAMDPKDQASVYTFSLNYPSERYRVFPSSNYLLEVVHPECSKSLGIKIIQDLLKIKANNILCFGDTTNDLEMISDYVGVWMSNGTRDVQDVAKYETITNNEAGIAYFLNENIL